MAKVVTEFVSDDKQVVASMDRLIRGMQQLQEENRKLKNATEESGKKSEEAFDKGITKVGSYLAGWVSIRSAIQLANNELERHKRLQDEAKETQERVANAQLAVMRNLPAGTNPQQVESRVAGLSREMGIPQEELYKAMREARLSASTLSMDQQMQALAYAAKVSPESMAGSLQGIQNLMASEKGMQAWEATGILQKIGAKSGSGFDDAWQRVLPTAEQMEGGGTIEQRAAIVAGISADPRFTGERGPRSAASLALDISAKLAEALPTSDRYSYDERGRRKLAAHGTGLETTEDRLDYLRAHPEEADRFMSGAHYTGKEASAAQDLMNPNSAISQRINENLKDFSRPTSPDTFIQTIQSTDMQRTGRGGRAVAQLSESRGLDDLGGSETSQAFDAFRTWEKYKKMGWLESTLNEARFWINPSSGYDFSKAQVQEDLNDLNKQRRDGLSKNARGDISEQEDYDRRAGIQGSEVTRMGAKGRPFVLQSRVDLQSYEEAKTLLDDYLGLVGADPVSVTQGGVTSQYLFIVLNINVLRIPPVAGGVGGFNSNPRALLECRWTLLAIPPFE